MSSPKSESKEGKRADLVFTRKGDNGKRDYLMAEAEDSCTESELSKRIVDALIPAFFTFATDFIGRKPRKKLRITKKERLKLAEGIDRLIGASAELESYKTPAQTAADYVSRLDRVGELYRPFLELPKGAVFPYALRDSFREMTRGIGRWIYFPHTNYNEVAADLDKLTSAAFAVNAAAADELLNEFWNSPDGAVVLRSLYTIVFRRCVYLGNAKRKLDRRLVERLIETYRELSGLYEKGIRIVVGTMGVLQGKQIAYSQLVKQPLGVNVNQVSKTYPWLTKDFDIVIRNSIAHITYVVSYNSKTITFKDNKTATTVTFRDFFRRCRLLSSLVAALLLLHVFFLYWRWKAVAEHYDRMKQEAKMEAGSSHSLSSLVKKGSEVKVKELIKQPPAGQTKLGSSLFRLRGGRPQGPTARSNLPSP